MSADALPRFNHLSEQSVSVHGTSVALDGRGLLIVGPSGSGKTGLAVELLVRGARLVSDDLTIIRRSETRLTMVPPGGSAVGIELRGLGIASPPSTPSTPLDAILLLAPSNARLPERETLSLLGEDVPLLRHPARPELAAKISIWLRYGMDASFDHGTAITLGTALQKPS